MTTDKAEFFIAVDSIGIMAKMTPSYTARALKTGEIVPTEQAGIYRLARTVAMNPLTGAQRRALELKRAKR